MTPPPEFIAFARREHLFDAGSPVQWQALRGGVSSDIWRASSLKRDLCIKRALPELKVAAHWVVPVTRNAFEWAYMETVQRILPEAVPRPIAHDPDNGLFAMDWLAPETHSLWKSELLAGRVDLHFAESVGEQLGRIHAATAFDAEVAKQFSTDNLFHALRLEPYFIELARIHTDLVHHLEQLVTSTAQTRFALVHGDVSPKNIFVGPDGPVFLDAECAWYGDPAFDLAFCLNHLVLKSFALPHISGRLTNAFDRLAHSYLACVNWEPGEAIEHRAAALLPVLTLARIDGKSPVEYLDGNTCEAVRRVAKAAIFAKPTTLTAARDLLVDRP